MKLSATEQRKLRKLLLMSVFAADEIGARIKQAREEAGLTQQDLADAVGVTPRTIQSLEAGAHKPYKYLKAIAEVTNRPFDWFLHESEASSDQDQLRQLVREELAEGLEVLDRLVPLLEDVLERLPSPTARS